MDPGDFEVVAELATGGMGSLVLANRIGPHGFARRVVVKRLRADLAGDERAALRLVDEARIAASLDHRNVCKILDVGVDDGLFLVLEHVDGMDLGELLDCAGALPVAHALTLAREIATGLHHVHEQTDAEGRPLGVIHRDISPPNVLLGRHGEVKLTDFGVARARERLDATRSGTVRGRLGYVAPERLRGDAVDRRVDVFALGVVLYEALAGRPLFTGDNDAETIDRVMAGDVPAVVPAELDPIIRRAVATDPAARYPDAAAMIDALDAVIALAGIRRSTRALGAFVREHLPARPWEARRA